jgi:hypothetical protein
MSAEIKLFEVQHGDDLDGYDVVIRFKRQLGGSIANCLKSASSRSPRHSAMVAMGYQIANLCNDLYTGEVDEDIDNVVNIGEVTIEEREIDPL